MVMLRRLLAYSGFYCRTFAALETIPDPPQIRPVRETKVSRTPHMDPF